MLATSTLAEDHYNDFSVVGTPALMRQQPDL